MFAAEHGCNDVVVWHIAAPPVDCYAVELLSQLRAELLCGLQHCGKLFGVEEVGDVLWVGVVGVEERAGRGAAAEAVAAGSESAVGAEGARVWLGGLQGRSCTCKDLDINVISVFAGQGIGMRTDRAASDCCCCRGASSKLD